MFNKNLGSYISVISHNRPNNVQKITELIGDCTFFVNNGERKSYINAGAVSVIESGDNICSARNKAISQARKINRPCIQVSDDLTYLREIYFTSGENYHAGSGGRKVRDVDFNTVVKTMVDELKLTKYWYGGIAVTSNRMNYLKGVNFTYDKLIVNDLICVMPNCPYEFDEDMALKEDYDFTLTNILMNGGLVRCNQFFGQFPHRNNQGGANVYRNSESEKKANERVLNKWGDFLKEHHSRENQISINYSRIKQVNKI